MDEAVIKQIQREGADALLDIGVSVPLKAFHIPGLSRQGGEPYGGLYPLSWPFQPPRAFAPGGMAHKELHGTALSGGCDQAFCQPDGYRPFYTYYQISRADESDELETEPKKEGELKSRYEGSHSPFGFVWQIASATGWSVDYILNKVNYQTLIMMLSDAPRYVRDKSGSSGPADERSAEDEADGIVGFFQSKLK